jgi:CheY-like chemotaxis protein
MGLEMPEPESEQESGTTPPEAFIEQVKDALEHLYDLAYLQRHPLVGQADTDIGHAGESSGQSLRRRLAWAIEALNPGPGVSFNSPNARLHNLLRLRYVEGLTVRETAEELGLSLRQAHRDLRSGEENVATLLWHRRHTAEEVDADAVRISSLQAEMAQFHTHPRPTDLQALLQHARQAVAQQAALRGVTVELGMPAKPVIASVDPTVAEQVMLNSLSYAVRQAYPGTLQVSLEAERGQVTVALQYFPVLDAPDAPVIELAVAQLADLIGWTIHQERQPDDSRRITLQAAVRGPTLLVIDDNEGLVDLLERYLTDQACRVVAATDGHEGLRLVRELSPDAIILDVMMPKMHGWEFLQRLSAQAGASTIPVIVCSVINNPDLAYCLGAAMFLPKPVSRLDVLTALRRVEVL